jgi:hypothetical protein
MPSPERQGQGAISKSQDGLDFSEVGNEIEKGCDCEACDDGASDKRDEIYEIDE